MATPAGRLGVIRFSLLAPFRTKSFIVGNKACTWSVGTFVSVRRHHSVPRYSFPPMPGGCKELPQLFWRGSLPRYLLTGTSDHLHGLYFQIGVFLPAGFFLLVPLPL